jgi:hypothetical protein
MTAGAGGGEGPRQREQHHRFAFEHGIAGDLLPFTIDPSPERDIGDSLTFAGFQHDGFSGSLEKDSVLAM